MSLSAIEAMLYADKERGPLSEAYATEEGDLFLVAYKPIGCAWRRVYVYEFSEGICSGYSSMVEDIDMLLSEGEWCRVGFEEFVEVRQ